MHFQGSPEGDHFRLFPHFQPLYSTFSSPFPLLCPIRGLAKVAYLKIWQNKSCKVRKNITAATTSGHRRNFPPTTILSPLFPFYNVAIAFEGRGGRRAEAAAELNFQIAVYNSPFPPLFPAVSYLPPPHSTYPTMRGKY